MIEKYEISSIAPMVVWSLARCCKSTRLGSIPAHDMNSFRLCHGLELIINQK